MKCPHCLDSFHEQLARTSAGDGPEGNWFVNHQLCPACGRSIVILEQRALGHSTYRTVFPKSTARDPIPAEVDDPSVVNDYTKAVLVLEDSPEASAALSRRCLQHILREKVQTKSRDLADQIQEVLDSKTLPSAIAENLDAVRATGNFAAHPTKSTNTGAIIDVEPHEAEWDLEVLEQLMDFYFVQPAKAQQRRVAMNAKLNAAGKPPLK